MTTVSGGVYLRRMGSFGACDGNLRVQVWHLAVETSGVIADLAMGLAAAHVPSQAPLAHPNARIADRLAPKGATRTGDFGEFLAAALYADRFGEIVPFQKLSTKPVAGATQQGADVLALSPLPADMPRAGAIEIKVLLAGSCGWVGGPGPFGYHVDPATKSLVPDPKEAATVQKIFAAYADEHLGATGLANRLNSAGLRNRGDRLWSNQTVLRVLRNSVYVGKISHGDEVYDGKHPSIVDGDLFARARALLDERAALVANRAPNTSEYLLTGMLRCRACGGAYFGAGTKGRNGFYRYYACRNRQTKGTYGCQRTRIPAEDLEAAVIDDLIRTLSRSDLFEQAITAAIADLADNRPSLEAELTSTEAQLRDTETGLCHHLRAFETGEMPAAICSPRVTELTQRRDELAAHRKKLTAQLKDATPQLSTPEQLRSLCAEIRQAIDSGNPDAVKQLLRELVDRVEITPERHAYPYFWVPAGCETGTPSGEPGPNAPSVSAEVSVVANQRGVQQGHRLAFRYIRWCCVVAIRTRASCWPVSVRCTG